MASAPPLAVDALLLHPLVHVVEHAPASLYGVLPDLVRTPALRHYVRRRIAADALVRMLDRLGACASLLVRCDDPCLLAGFFCCIGEYLPSDAPRPDRPGRRAVDPLRRWPLRVRARIRRSLRLQALL